MDTADGDRRTPIFRGGRIRNDGGPSLELGSGSAGSGGGRGRATGVGFGVGGLSPQKGIIAPLDRQNWRWVNQGPFPPCYIWQGCPHYCTPGQISRDGPDFPTGHTAPGHPSQIPSANKHRNMYSSMYVDEERFVNAPPTTPPHPHPHPSLTLSRSRINYLLAERTTLEGLIFFIKQPFDVELRLFAKKRIRSGRNCRL